MEKNTEIFEKDRYGRIIIVASAIGLYLLGMIPDSVVSLSYFGTILSYIVTIGIFANYIYDGRPK